MSVVIPMKRARAPDEPGVHDPHGSGRVVVRTLGAHDVLLQQDPPSSALSDPVDARPSMRRRLARPERGADACADCRQPLLPGRAYAHGDPLRSLCAWCYACRRFPRKGPQRTVRSFAETQTAEFRELSRGTLERLLAMRPVDQRALWADQLNSERSLPLCSFRDRASDSLLCSLLAWEESEPRARSLFAPRTSVLREIVVPLAEEMLWDEREQDDFFFQNEIPHEYLVAAARHTRELRAASWVWLKRRSPFRGMMHFYTPREDPDGCDHGKDVAHGPEGARFTGKDCEGAARCADAGRGGLGWAHATDDTGGASLDGSLEYVIDEDFDYAEGHDLLALDAAADYSGGHDSFGYAYYWPLGGHDWLLFRTGPSLGTSFAWAVGAGCATRVGGRPAASVILAPERSARAGLRCHAQVGAAGAAIGLDVASGGFPHGRCAVGFFSP